MIEEEKPNLETAIALAALAHSGQTDKAGEPYILHPLRLMQRFTDERLRIAAVLHDVVEDSAIDLETIGEVFDPEMAVTIDHLTRREGESYTDFIKRCSEDPTARTVKLVDLEDNLNINRLNRAITAQDIVRTLKYRAAHDELKGMEA